MQRGIWHNQLVLKWGTRRCDRAALSDASDGLRKNKPEGGKLLMRTRAAWGYGATVARLTPDQKVGISNLSVLILCAHAGLVPSLGTLALRLRA